MNRLELRTAIRQAADMVGSLFVNDTTELNPWIDAAVRSLYAVLVRTFGDTTFAKSEWINVGPNANNAEGSTDLTVLPPKLAVGIDPTTYGGFVLASELTPDRGIPSKYTLPDDFERLVRVLFVRGYVAKPDAVSTSEGYQYGPEWRLVGDSGQRALPMTRMNFQGSLVSFSPAPWGQGNVKYRLHAGPHRMVFGAIDQITGDPVGSPSQFVRNTAIEFTPIPDSNYAVQIVYVPKPYLLVDDVTELPYDYPEWVIAEVAARCLEKQRSDSSVQRAIVESIRVQLTEEHQTDDAANPPMMTLIDETDHPRAPWEP